MTAAAPIKAATVAVVTTKRIETRTARLVFVAVAKTAGRFMLVDYSVRLTTSKVIIATTAEAAAYPPAVSGMRVAVATG